MRAWGTIEVMNHVSSPRPNAATRFRLDTIDLPSGRDPANHLARPPHAAGQPQVLRSSAGTHVGCVRWRNEDAVIALPDLGVWAVSDGMGGHDAGDFASRTVVDCLAKMSPGPAPMDALCGVRSAIEEAHATIEAEARRRGGVTIGATVVALLVANGHFACLWVGDSRLYRVRDGEIAMISDDHSEVAELVDAGLLTWAEADRRPGSNAVTRAVGVGEVPGIDKRCGDIRRGDRFLLCSDGLSRHADEDCLLSLLGRRAVDSAAGALINHAIVAGGADNISAIVLDVT